MKSFVITHTSCGLLNNKNYSTFEEAMRGLLTEIRYNPQLYENRSTENKFEIKLLDDEKEDKGRYTSYYAISNSRLLKLHNANMLN